MAEKLEKEQKEELTLKVKTDVKSEILAQLQDDIQKNKSSELLLQITSLVEAQMQLTSTT